MNKNIKKAIVPYAILLVVGIAIILLLNLFDQKINKLTYDQFESNLMEKKIESIEVVPKDRARIYQLSGKIKGYEKNEYFVVEVPRATVFRPNQRAFIQS